MVTQDDSSETQASQLTRRKLLVAGGTTLIGATLSGSLFDMGTFGQGMQNMKGLMSKNGGMKPTILPASESTDPVAFSIAENIFWNDQLMEHAKFFIMLMPGPELAVQRSQAERFQQTFSNQLAQSKVARLNRNNYKAFNQSTINQVKPFVDWKRKMGDAQASGQLKSLTWSTFFDHTANEADRFAQRLDQFSRGNISTDMREAAKFWTMIMGEHADFIAHLLDPEERVLITQAMETSDAFRKMHENVPSSKSPLEKAVNDIIDFKTAAEKGIQTGQIKSIIHPTLADHVRREALKAADELKRAA
ncbi:MAG: DUF2935 domain-containing protein [Pyrinomonadaceae bacterium]